MVCDQQQAVTLGVKLEDAVKLGRTDAARGIRQELELVCDNQELYQILEQVAYHVLDYGHGHKEHSGIEYFKADRFVEYVRDLFGDVLNVNAILDDIGWHVTPVHCQ